MARKPTPKVVSEVCSLCGLDWSLHGANPTTETCIGLLLDEVASLNARLAVRPISLPQSYPVYPRPWRNPWPYGPSWSPSGGSTLVCTTAHMPGLSSATPRAVNVTEAVFPSGAAEAS